MYVSDVIYNDIGSWEPCDSIFIQAGTGTGKTTFILEKLLFYAKNEGERILFLSNRTLLKEQIKAKVASMQGITGEALSQLENINQFDGITVMSYQTLQERHNANTLNISRYKYLVCDEIHYIIEDSAFNPNIAHFIDVLKGYNNICIFMSATMQGIMKVIEDIRHEDRIIRDTYSKESEYLEKWKIERPVTTACLGLYSHIWSYRIPSEKQGVNVKYFTDYAEIYDETQKGDQEKKWLIFVSNKDKARKLQNMIGNDAVLISAEERGVVFQEILENQKFTARVLITTKVLDNGITIKDTNLSHIVIDTISEREFVQMLGRKRFIDEDDKVDLYIPRKNLKEFNGYYHKMRHEYSFIKLNYNMDALMYLMMKGDQDSTIIKKYYYYSNKKHVLILNSLAEMYLCEQIQFLKYIIESMEADSDAFLKEQLKWIGKEDTFSERASITYQNILSDTDELIEYLNQNCNKELEEEKKQKLQNMVKGIYRKQEINKVKKSRDVGRSKINTFFEENEISYRLDSVYCKGREKRWIIKKMCAGE